MDSRPAFVRAVQIQEILAARVKRRYVACNTPLHGRAKTVER
jgi:hypothetical protein